MGRTLSRWQERIACGIAATVLLILIAPPLVAAIKAAISEPLDTWGALLDPRLLKLLGNTITIASATTASSLCLGVPLGALLGRARVRFAGLALFLHAVPLVLPPFITALVAFQLFGQNGWLGSAATASWLFDELGCILVLTISLAPVITVVTWLGVRGTDPTGDEAARIIAGPWRTLLHVILPQAVPFIALGAIIVFSLALIEVAVPMFLRVDVYSAAVFARLGGFAFAPGEAAGLALPLVALSMLLWIIERGSRARRVVILPPTRSKPVALLDTSRAITIVVVTGVLAAGMGVAPVIAMAFAAFNGNGFSLLGEYAGNTVLNSFAYAAGVSTIVVAVAIGLTSVIQEYPKIVASQDALAWLGFLLPPALFSIGAIEVWNQQATQWIYGGAGVVILALAARYAVIAVRIQLAGVRQLSPSLIESARVSGGTYLHRLMRIYWPALRRFTAGAWLLVFVFCLRDIETTALLYPPGGEPLTVRLFTLEANGPPAVIAALCVVLAVMTLVPLSAASVFLRGMR